MGAERQCSIAVGSRDREKLGKECHILAEVLRRQGEQALELVKFRVVAVTRRKSGRLFELGYDRMQRRLDAMGRTEIAHARMRLSPDRVLEGGDNV